jgi:hypothetical protein
MPAQKALETSPTLTMTRALGILARHPRDGGRRVHTSLDGRGLIK